MGESDQEIVDKLKKLGYTGGAIEQAMTTVSIDTEAQEYKKGITRGLKIIQIPDTQVKENIPY